MCDDTILKTLKGRQVKPKELKCTASSTCWCSGVTYKIEYYSDVCMSPAEMLEHAQHEMNAQDIKYLKTLSKYKFNPESP